MFALLLVLFATVPQDNDVLRDDVDVVELNHFYDDQGRHVFDQLIWMEWTGHNAYKIQAWRLIKDNAHSNDENVEGRRIWDEEQKKNKTDIPYTDKPALSQWTPHYNYNTKCWEVLFYDQETLRLVRAKSKRETWTQFDPELINREIFPKEGRRELQQKPQPKPKEGVSMIWLPFLNEGMRIINAQ